MDRYHKQIQYETNERMLRLLQSQIRLLAELETTPTEEIRATLKIARLSLQDDCDQLDKYGNALARLIAGDAGVLPKPNFAKVLQQFFTRKGKQ